MDNYQAMNFYYGLLNLHAGLFRTNLCESLRLVTQNTSKMSSPISADHHLKPSEQTIAHDVPGEVAVGSFNDGHILRNVKIETQSDFFLNPMRGDSIKWRVNFTVDKAVRPADQFIIQFSSNLIVAPNGHPQKPIADYVDQDGLVIAIGEYQVDRHRLVYTFTNYVTSHKQVYGKISGELTIDPVTVPMTKFGMKGFIAVDDYRRDFTVDTNYPDVSGDTFLGIFSRMMSFDVDKHLFTDLIYVNPAEKQLNRAYLIFNTSEMVEELSNVIATPSTMHVEVFQNSRHLNLPQSYGINVQRLQNITDQFSIVEGDHLVNTPLTISFADNKVRLNFVNGSDTASYVIRVTGQYNDELNGAVRLRARLFGVDQTNVYMSNSTVAVLKETPMVVSGTLVNEATSIDDTTKNTTSRSITMADNIRSNESNRIGDVSTGSSAYIVKFSDSIAGADSSAVETVNSAKKQRTAEAVNENVAELESRNATEYDRHFAALLKENMEKIQRGEEIRIEPEKTAPLPMPSKRPPRRRGRFDRRLKRTSLRRIRRR